MPGHSSKGKILGVPLSISSHLVLDRLAIALAFAALTSLCGQSACQAASLRPDEVRVLGKALNFLDPPLTGRPVVALVYKDGNDLSHRDAEALAEQLDGATLGGVAVRTLVIGSRELATAQFQLVITADAVDSEPVIEAARAHRALCITAEVEAVSAGHCTMAIRSARRVEIFINRDAAAQSGFSFATAFRMMVHEQ
jgi:hypothetical protein